MVNGYYAGRGLRTLIALALGLGAVSLAACSVQPATPSTSQGNTPNAQASPPVRQAPPAAPNIQTGASIDLQSRVLGEGNTGIWVTGRGEAAAPPDLAVLNLGIEAFASTVQQARADAAAAMERVIGVLKARNVADKDIQTRHFNIAPRYSSRKVTRCVDGATPSTPRPGGRPLEAKGECFEEHQQVILGYQVTNQLTVKLRDLNAIGGVIDAATEAGGDLTRLQGISFTIDDARALEAQARAAAIADLQGKAKQFAALTGVKLGPLRFITETAGPVPIRPQVERAIAAAPAAPTPIRAGELEVVVTVQGVFAIE